MVIVSALEKANIPIPGLCHLTPPSFLLLPYIKAALTLREPCALGLPAFKPGPRWV